MPSRPMGYYTGGLLSIVAIVAALIGASPKAAAQTAPGAAPNAAATPDLETTFDYIGKNSTPRLDQQWVVVTGAGNRVNIHNATSFIYTRANRCSLTITRNETIDALDTADAVQAPNEWYYLWGLHVENAITDYKYSHPPTTHDSIKGTNHLQNTYAVTEVLNFDRLYIGDLKLYPITPNALPMKAPFTFLNSESALRIMRAIDHAAELCGAATDPFAK